MAVHQRNAQDVAKKWSQNLAASGDSIRAGVNAVQQSPGASAAARRDAYLAGVQANVDKWASNVGAMTLVDWRNAMINKGLPRIAQGAQQAVNKYAAFYTQFGLYLQQLEGQLQQTPRGGLEANIQRMVTAIRFLADFKLNPVHG